MSCHTLFHLFCVFEIKSRYIILAGFKLLDPNNAPSQVKAAGATGEHHLI